MGTQNLSNKPQSMRAIPSDKSDSKFASAFPRNSGHSMGGSITEDFEKEESKPPPERSLKKKKSKAKIKKELDEIEDTYIPDKKKKKKKTDCATSEDEIEITEAVDNGERKKKTKKKSKNETGDALITAEKDTNLESFEQKTKSKKKSKSDPEKGKENEA